MAGRLLEAGYLSQDEQAKLLPRVCRGIGGEDHKGGRPGTLRLRFFNSTLTSRELFIQALNRNLNPQRFNVLYIRGNYSDILSRLDSWPLQPISVHVSVNPLRTWPQEIR